MSRLRVLSWRWLPRGCFPLVGLVIFEVGKAGVRGGRIYQLTCNRPRVLLPVLTAAERFVRWVCLLLLLSRLGLLRKAILRFFVLLLSLEESDG